MCHSVFVCFCLGCSHSSPCDIHNSNILLLLRIISKLLSRYSVPQHCSSKSKCESELQVYFGNGPSKLLLLYLFFFLFWSSFQDAVKQFYFTVQVPKNCN